MTQPSSQMKIALAADHGGFEMKAALIEMLAGLGYAVDDLGTHSADSVDYPDFGRKMGDAITAGEANFGVIICGTGIGISIAANRNKAVRAALCHDTTTARLAREHNDANVIALGARVIGLETAMDCVKIFIDTAFDGGERHVRRIEKLG